MKHCLMPRGKFVILERLEIPDDALEVSVKKQLTDFLYYITWWKFDMRSWDLKFILKSKFIVFKSLSYFLA